MSRRSKRKLRQELEELESEEQETVGLITVLSTAQGDGTIESVPGQYDKIRINGEIKQLTPNAQEQLGGYYRTGDSVTSDV